MNNSHKSWKTNMVGYVGVASVVVIFALVFTEKATMTEATTSLGALAAFLGIMNSFLSKDADVTHSKRSNIVDPDKDEYPDTKF